MGSVVAPAIEPLHASGAATAMVSAAHGPCDTGVIGAARSATPAHPTATLAATVLGSSVAFIDGSVVNVALATIQHDLGASTAGAQWLINAYLLPLGALVLLGGAAGDRYGRRRIFMTGLGLFALASAACAAAPTLGVLLAARALQGIGAALLMPASLAILGGAFAGEARGRAIGTWAAAGAVTGAIGPVLGGWLVDTAGWRAIFLINLPIAAAAMALAWRFVGSSRDDDADVPLDAAGAVLATLGLGALTWGLTLLSATRTADPVAIGALTIGIAALLGFLAAEQRRGDRAMMPLALFTTATFVGVTLLTLFLYAALGGLLVLFPYLLIRIGHYAGTAAGAAMLPIPILMGLGSRAVGRLAERTGPRLPLTLGPLLVAGGFFLLSRSGAERVDYWWTLFPALLVIGAGLAVSVAPLTATVMAAVDQRHVGAASGTNNAVARVGGLLATALLGLVLANAGSDAAFVAAFRLAAMVGGALAVLAALSALMLIGPGSDPQQNDERPRERGRFSVTS